MILSLAGLPHHIRVSRQKSHHGLRRVALLLILFTLEGCYYVQAIRGHTELMNRRRPVAEVIADDDSSDELRRKLALVQAARDFAVSELMLPDNDSYRSYADLERDFVVWNVFAAPEFDLEAKTWCFPVAGCVAYRGYFSESSAAAFSKKLAGQGYDVTIGGVSAYSTLGRFADPLLNTMMRWTDVDLVTTMFHELAHQKLYVKGDSMFNESFASVVADYGIARWLDLREQIAAAPSAGGDEHVRRSMMALVVATRVELNTLYDGTMTEDRMRQQKNSIFRKLSDDAEALVRADGGKVRNWLAAPMNNARLVSMNLYEGRFNAFQSILATCDDDLRCFYARAERLAELSFADRSKQLANLQHQLPISAPD